jgi:hypothetical protein
MQRKLLLVKLSDLVVEMEKLGPRPEYAIANQFWSSGMLAEDLVRRGVSHEEIARARREVEANGRQRSHSNSAFE